MTYVTTAVNCGKLVGLLGKRFEILERIRVEAEGGQEEEDIARDPLAVMSRERWPAPWWKVSLRCPVIFVSRLRRLVLEDEIVSVFVYRYFCCLCPATAATALKNFSLGSIAVRARCLALEWEVVTGCCPIGVGR